MKRVIRFLFLSVLITLILGTKALAQSQDFLIGAFITSSSNSEVTYYRNYWQVKQLGLNSVFQRNIVSIPPVDQADNFDSLMQFSTIIAHNDSVPVSAFYADNIDWIYYFTNALYSKWESEGSPYFNSSEPVGVKHNNIGYQTSDGWSSGVNMADTGKFFIAGPNYSQYMKYVYTNKYNPNNFVSYNANFRMKLSQPQEGIFPVARIIVSVKNASTGYETILVDSVFYSNQLSTTYSDFNISYDYAAYFPQQNESSNYTGTQPPGPAWYSPQSSPSSEFFDNNLKIQFKVARLGAPEVVVDYIEVYDEEIWNGWFTGANYAEMLNQIITYNQKFTSLSTNLKYYHTIDEPHSIDCMIPIKTVQSILQDTLGISKDLITHFYPGWDNNRDGVNILEKWTNIAKPKKLMFWYFPYWVENTNEFGLRFFRNNLKQASQLQEGFYSTLQTWGYKRIDNGNYFWYRTPLPNEVSAEVMLALANGAKGILFEPYYSYTSWLPEIGNIEVEAIVDKINGQGNFIPRDIYYKIQELTTRLNGKLGASLTKLKHTNNTVNSTLPVPDEPQITQYDYFQLINLENNYDYDWFAGFMYDSSFSDRKYFLITNLRTEESKNVNFSITNNTDYSNLGIFDVEGNSNTIDTTIQTTSNFSFQIPAGEGYLFQVAPVVLYGGRLLYNETVGGGWTLYDDMIIENGATLTVTGTYNANANITVKDGGSIKTVDGGVIIFSTGKRLIIDGLATVKGTASQKLTLDFNDQELTIEGSCIQVNLGSDFTLSYCIVINSSIGLSVLMPEIQPAFQNLNINNSTFDNCGTAININGNPVIDAKVKNCLITNSSTGIVVTNNNKITVQSNTITNSDLGIFLEFTSNTNIIGNQINSTLESMPGILMSSAGGHLRTNTITGHTIGISLANSFPKIGGNTIYGNLINGIYISTYSEPDLRPALAGNPPNMYPLSGYNLIYENGGYEATTLLNDDGSEIFINNGFIKLGNGCNQIMDDRNQNQNLVTTLLLMNSNPLIPVSTIKADTNYWSTVNFDPTGRFGNLTVQYQPYLIEPCILPQSGGQMLVTQSSTGDVIDTLYSSGVDVGTLTGIDALYAQADQYYITAQTEQAKTVYEQIITDYPDDPKSIYAYSAVFMLTRLSGDSTQFSALRELYQQRLTTVTDTLLSKTLSQLSALCFVNEQDYQSAITYFEEIMSDQPNTDAALFAEIDALTTSMIAGSDTTQLGKGLNNRILVKGTADYLSKVNNLLKGRFGYQKPEEEKIIPEQYFLYQNYPNPFNPTTSIKFDLPQAGNVELTVYDILGREVKQLLNETKPAGTYELTFNASKLASGVYIYSIKSNDFTASKKLMVLK